MVIIPDWTLGKIITVIALLRNEIKGYKSQQFSPEKMKWTRPIRNWRYKDSCSKYNISVTLIKQYKKALLFWTPGKSMPDGSFRMNTKTSENVQRRIRNLKHMKRAMAAHSSINQLWTPINSSKNTSRFVDF